MRVCMCAWVPDHQWVHVHLDVGGSRGIVPEGEGSIFVQESREAECVCQDSSDVRGCIQRAYQLPPTLGIVLLTWNIRRLSYIEVYIYSSHKVSVPGQRYPHSLLRPQSAIPPVEWNRDTDAMSVG